MESTAGPTPPPTWFGSSWATGSAESDPPAWGTTAPRFGRCHSDGAGRASVFPRNSAGDQDGQIAVHLGWGHPGVGPLDKSVDHLWGDVGMAVAEVAPGRRHLRLSRLVGSSLRGSHQGRLRVNVNGRSHPGCPGPGPSIVDCSRGPFRRARRRDLAQSIGSVPGVATANPCV